MVCVGVILELVGARLDCDVIHYWELGLRETGVLDDMLDEVGRTLLLMDSYYHSNKAVGIAMEKGSFHW